jgi:FG-GAP-like repeat/FG-GAP repeat
MGFSPLLADLNHDGTPDLITLTRSGNILFRKGIPNQPGIYAPPITLNPGRPAKDVTLVTDSTGLRLAALDKKTDAISFYSIGTDNSVRYTAEPATEPLAVHIASADLNGDGFSDLVVTDASTGTASIYLTTAGGGFVRLTTPPLGAGPSTITLADVDGQYGPDIVVTNQVSGDVSVLLNNATHSFTTERRYRAGTGVYGVSALTAPLAVQSADKPAGIVAGSFTGGPFADLIVADGGANSFSLLRNLGDGEFANPQGSLPLATGSRPTVTAAGRFTRGPNLDLAVLNEQSKDISIFLGDGRGGFVEKVVRDADGKPIPLSAGDAPIGLSVYDVNGDGVRDLVVANPFGDVLTLLGNGDGTFRPFVRADQRVPLVLTMTADGKPEVILANQAQDVASAQVRVAGTNTFTPGAFQQNRSNGLIGPGAIAQADLNNDGIPDLIIANSGSNNVLVYLGLKGGGFSAAPQSFSVGDNPVGLYVTHLMGANALPDLVVANQGSNDVSVLLGSTDANGNWTLTEGPRLASGGVGPIAVTSRTDSVTGVQDLLVTNGQSGNIATLTGIGSNGVGTGFFNDVDPTVQQIASGPVQQTTLLPSSNGDLLGVALTQSGSLMRFDLTAGTTTTLFTPAVGNAVNAFKTMDLPGQAFPVIFTANANGSVSALFSTDGQSYLAKATVANAALTGPSALEVLQTDSSGQFDVYLTDAGQSTPVVLSLDLNAELTPVNNGGNGDSPSDSNGSLGLVITLVTNLQVDTKTPTQDQITVDPFSSAASEATSVTTVASLASNLGDNEALPSFGQAVLVNVIVSFTDATGGDNVMDGVASVTEETHDAPTLQQFIVGVEDAIDRLVASQATAPGAAITASADAALPAVADAIIRLGDWVGATVRDEAGVRIPAAANAVVRWGDWAKLTKTDGPAVMFGGRRSGFDLRAAVRKRERPGDADEICGPRSALGRQRQTRVTFRSKLRRQRPDGPDGRDGNRRRRLRRRPPRPKVEGRRASVGIGKISASPVTNPFGSRLAG